MATQAQGNTLSVFSLLEAFRRRKFLIIIPAVLLCAGFALYAYTQPNRYRAQSLVAAENLAPPDYLKHVSPEPINIQEHLWTVREVLYGPDILNAAAREMKVYRDVKEQLPEEALDDVRARIVVKVESEHTFHISYEGGDPAEVMNVTNKVAELFTERASAKRDKKVADAKGVIDDELKTVKERLEKQDEAMRSYRQRAVNELPEHMDFNIKEVDSLRAQYEERTSRIGDEEAKRTTVSKQLRQLEDQGVLNQPMVTEKTPAEIRLDDLRMKEREFGSRGYKTTHPDVISLRDEIRSLETSIANAPIKPRTEPSANYSKYTELKSQLEGIDQRIDAYRREQSRLSAQTSAYQKRVEATPQHQRVLDEMKRDYHVRESQYHALLDKQLDASMAQGLQKSETGIAFSVVEPATLPTTPFSPQRERLIMMGLFVGLGLGLVMAFLLEQNDTTFSSVDEFHGFTSVPVMGAIPSVNTSRTGQLNELVIAANDPDSVAAEQFRLLAMKVQQQCIARNAGVVMVTSATGSEGKSMVAVNLAQSLASMVDGSVLLIDGDMRKPRIHEYLGVKSFEGRGFYQLLQSTDGDYAKHTLKIGNFSVIPGSTPTGNPVAALSSTKARAIFEQLRQNFRYIVVDAPPTLPVADSHLLAGMSDQVLFVVRARKTPRELFQHAVESFDSANLMGAVLNDVDYQRSRYAYAYKYYKKSA